MVLVWGNSLFGSFITWASTKALRHVPGVIEREGFLGVLDPLIIGLLLFGIGIALVVSAIGLYKLNPVARKASLAISLVGMGLMTLYLLLALGARLYQEHYLNQTLAPFDLSADGPPILAALIPTMYLVFMWWVLTRPHAIKVFEDNANRDPAQ